MNINPITFKNFNTGLINSIKTKPAQENSVETNLDILLKKFCDSFSLPEKSRNYCSYDENLATKIIKYKEDAVPHIIKMFDDNKDEKEITAGLLLLNRLYDNGMQKSWDIYPVISKYNYNKSPNIQVMLAGIYRKIQVPDAFGPLMAMFVKNTQQEQNNLFDPNEEIGGAILEYLRNTSAKENYKKIV